MPYILPLATTWPFTKGRKHTSLESMESEIVWVVYCKKCGHVISTRRWLNEYPDDINFQGCVVNSAGHDLWEKILPDKNILVIWKEVQV